MTAGKTVWLKCSVREGMLPGEHAVEVQTTNIGKISLFAPDDKVDAARGLLRVKYLDADETSTLVRLPASPFEISSQNVRVYTSALLAFEAEQKK